MSAADIAVVVVTYRSLETIDACLARLRDADGVCAIRVVDNGSDDGTMEIVQRHAAQDARVHFVANPDNPGFAVACNQGTQDLPRDNGVHWLAFVNPDCLLEVDSLVRLRTHARAFAGEVVLGADLVDEAGVRDAAARRRDPDFGAMLGSALRAGSAAAQLGVAPDDALRVQPVSAISGALMFFPRSLFERLGGFDQGYRLHAEDLDLCRRARNAGAAIVVANDVRVVHVRGVSSRSRPVFVEWHKHRGLWRYFRKFEAPQRGPGLRFAVWAMIWLRFPLAAARASWRARSG